MIKIKRSTCTIMTYSTLGLLLSSTWAWSLDLDWAGQFRSEAHMVKNYTLDSGNVSRDTTRSGYYIPGGGESSAHFQTVFLRLRPTLIVNDVIDIKSEWWVGDPIFGMFGDSMPFSPDQKRFYSTQSRGSTITAQRYWAEVKSDFGSIILGRAPLHWGLGVVWNAGEGVFDRYSSTGDTIRLEQNFGAFYVSPGFIKYSTGNNIGGNCKEPTGLCGADVGKGGMRDYSFIFKYDNKDEDFQLGLNFIRRVISPNQDSSDTGSGASTTVDSDVGGSVLTIWDIYVKKQLGRLTLAGEVPIATGDVGGQDYKGWGLAIETGWKISSAWDSWLKVGQASGQPNTNSASAGGSYRAFFFNPNYKLGLIMFNYQLANFAGPNVVNNNDPEVPGNLRSAFDNPVVNARYAAGGVAFQTGKWQFRSSVIYASALETADSSASHFYNTVTHEFQPYGAAPADQSSSLGLEWDFGTSFLWDDALQFDFDFGLWFPGSFYKFSASATENQTDTAFAAVVRVGIKFGDPK